MSIDARAVKADIERQHCEILNKAGRAEALEVSKDVHDALWYDVPFLDSWREDYSRIQPPVPEPTPDQFPITGYSSYGRILNVRLTDGDGIARVVPEPSTQHEMIDELLR